MFVPSNESKIPNKIVSCNRFGSCTYRFSPAVLVFVQFDIIVIACSGMFLCVEYN
ncbi:MAG: hypothetical protein P8X87_07205 [Candidatus Bathyarchaeota archaeon]